MEFFYITCAIIKDIIWTVYYIQRTLLQSILTEPIELSYRARYTFTRLNKQILIQNTSRCQQAPGVQKLVKCSSIIKSIKNMIGQLQWDLIGEKKHPWANNIFCIVFFDMAWWVIIKYNKNKNKTNQQFRISI